jgi:hypothetical protein
MARLWTAVLLVLTTTLVAQEPPVTVSGDNLARVTQAEWNDLRFADDAPDTLRVCIDDAMTVCLTVGEIRALAHAEGEIGPLDQARRELLGFQALYSTTLSELDQCRGQLGPLRAQANQKGLSEQVEAWIADLEKRNPGWTYDRQTGALVKAPAPPEKKPGGGGTR